MSGKIIYYDERSEASPEVIDKLLRSREDAKDVNKKVITCPICGCRIIELYAKDKPLLDVKCRKCKFTGPLNTAYFRRQRRRNMYFK